MRSVCTIALFLAAISTIPTEVLGQQPRLRSGIDVSHEPIFLLQRLLVASGKIFSGTVLHIEHRNPNSSSALATTRVVFRVDEAIRNVRRGQILEVDEWAGLWQSGERYRPGERVLLFLYPPSRLGLTSPVENRAGRFAVNRTGSVTVKAPVGKQPRTIEIRRVIAAIREAEKNSR